MFKKLGQKAKIVVFGIASGCVTSIVLVLLSAPTVVQTVLVFVGSAVATFVTLQVAGETMTGGKTSSTAQSKVEPEASKEP